MVKETTTIRISKEIKAKLDKVKGKEPTYEEFINYLIDFFMGDTK